MKTADLKKIYGEKTKAYIELVKKDFAEKYDKRGTWMEDGPYGGYVNSGNFLKARQPERMDLCT